MPLPGKLLEKIVHDRFSSLFEENDFLTFNQGGFRKGFSTTATLADITNNFQFWCTANKLSINAKKTKLMVFGSRSKIIKAKNVQIYLQGCLLQKVPTFKYVGLIWDSTLTYNHHIASVIRSVLHKITLLAKMKRYLNNEVALQIYTSMVLPYLDYADVIFHKANITVLDKLQRLQNRCLKICSGLDRLFDKVHKRLSIPFLKDRRKAHVFNFL